VAEALLSLFDNPQLFGGHDFLWVTASAVT
jgi:hypothetical protein